ncbi:MULTISPECIES: tryptophan--tRNA ligase [Cetobacterium]|jgi:tryptophanyl-tRNA synthetase|uniref:Tryptophan--tRNA ligase n=1 Tax=Candidatus Cetobacterium colombiensis TaxID=3073100 RepID=A0ABU4WBP3_9FUSO|nr:tryptophan--tRNA ligase [Candidatus Cetobacterium colombiensis]MDX8336963.1 tryptophan--tRNA ligase [Candidatus Cetobacterium colombiensis]
MKRSISGIQPSGILHLGNYFGAMKQFIENQEKYEGFYFIADYHSLTSLTDPKALRENSYNIVLDYLALGLDPEKSTIFLQSDVPEHVELMWLLSNITPVGLLERGHSYKDKVAKGFTPNTGLLTYPVLMASDILMYDADIVPVGKDQKQHLEMTRDIALKFNQQYEVELFKLPEPQILESLAVIPGTDGQKMSKSYGNTINMFASKKELKKQVMSIVTDSTPLEEPKNPDNNIVKLYELFATKEQVEEMKNKFTAGNYGYGHAKTELLNAILDYFKDAREKREELANNMEYVEEVLARGAAKAREIAKNKVTAAKIAVGLAGNAYRK